jgi:hypothetical protein
VIFFLIVAGSSGGSLRFAHLIQPGIFSNRQCPRGFNACLSVPQVFRKELLPKENQTGLNKGFGG